MHRSKISSGLACVSFISLTSFVTADTIAPETRNAAFAPLTILEDHPQCNNLGEVAFRADFESGNLAFSAYASMNPNNGVSVDEQGQVLQPSERCYVIQRRGTDRIQVEVDCGDKEPTRSPFVQRDLEQSTLSVIGSFTVCQSPTAFKVLESEWHARFSMYNRRADHTGTFFEFPTTGCDETRVVPGVNAIMSYAGSDRSRSPSSLDSRYSFRRSVGTGADGAAFFKVDLFGIPVPKRDGYMSGWEVRSSATFFPTIDGGARYLEVRLLLEANELSNEENIAWERFTHN